MGAFSVYGGGLRIRTLGGDKPSTVFKTAAFDHSASPPENVYNFLPQPRRSAKQAELYSSGIPTQEESPPCVVKYPMLFLGLQAWISLPAIWLPADRCWPALTPFHWGQPQERLLLKTN